MNSQTSCEALGLRANPPENKEFLIELYPEANWQSLAESGLWLESDRKRRLDRLPNTEKN
jgi:hypothetical protein